MLQDLGWNKKINSKQIKEFWCPEAESNHRHRDFQYPLFKSAHIYQIVTMQKFWCATKCATGLESVDKFRAPKRYINKYSHLRVSGGYLKGADYGRKKTGWVAK